MEHPYTVGAAVPADSVFSAGYNPFTFPGIPTVPYFSPFVQLQPDGTVQFAPPPYGGAAPTPSQAFFATGAGLSMPPLTVSHYFDEAILPPPPAQQQKQQRLPQQQQQQQQWAAAGPEPMEDYSTGVKLFVGQVPNSCPEVLLTELFASYGELLEVKIMKDPRTKRGKGYAWVRYKDLASAEKAIEDLNGKRTIPPQVNPLRVQFASQRPTDTSTDGVPPV